MGTRTFHRDGLLALTGLLALHALFAWVLMRAMRPSAETGTGIETALQVVFLPTRKIAAPAERTAIRNRNATERPATADATRKERQAAITPARPTPTPTPAADSTPASAPIQAVLIGQAAAAAVRVAPIEIAPTDALASRHARLPGRAGGRFRMHDRLSPQQVVAMAGKLFGGMSAREVRAEVCARNRQNLVNAAAAGDSLALRVELDTQHRYCNP